MFMREVPREKNMGVKSKQVNVGRVVGIQVTRMVGSA